jgi:hypothetical protein
MIYNAPAIGDNELVPPRRVSGPALNNDTQQTNRKANESS